MAGRSRLAALADNVKAHQCSLSAGRTHAVPGEGSAASEVMFVGEAPGAQEDQQGRPFVGAAGRMLAKGLELAGWTRESVYITNVVKCRPPGNRKPTAKEVAEHRSFLERELELLRPKLVVALGLTAAQFFLPRVRLGDVRGQALPADGRLLFVTYHPAATFRYPDKREVFLEDMRALPRVLAGLL